MPLPLPTFQALEIEDQPWGIVVRPRGNATTWLIEAVVWLIGAGGAAAMIAFGAGSWMRIVGCVVIVPIGLRALLRTIRFATTKFLRSVKVMLNVPQPSVNGLVESVAIAAVARFEIVRKAGDLYFSAQRSDGKVAYLAQIDPGQERDYQALGAWITSSAARPG